MSFRRIAVPTDFSSCAQRAADCALDIAAASGAELTVLHIDEVSDLRSGDGRADTHRALQAVSAHHRRRVEVECENERARLLASGIDVPISAAVRGGRLVDSIEEFVGEDSTDLLCIGSRGASGSLRFLFGSVAGRVTRSASCPVLVVRDGEGGRLPPLGASRTVVGVDYSPLSMPSVALAASLTRPGGVVHVLHVAPLLPWESGEGGHEVASELLSHQEDSEVQFLHRFIQAIPPGGRQLIGSVLRGSPAQSLLVESSRLDAELIVVGAHGREGIVENLIGTVADRVLRHAAVPVAVAPRQT